METVVYARGLFKMLCHSFSFTEFDRSENHSNYLVFTSEMIQLGINGLGRIGRVILRACLLKSDLEITAINDPAIDVHYICYLIKFDSTHGKFDGSITPTKDEILINDKRIKIFHEKLPANIPWQTAGVQYVIEASGMFTTIEKASGHLASETVRRVILTAPSVDIPMLILGVNDDKISSSQKVVSCTSSTLYCLAPIIKVLEDAFGLAEGFVTSIHAMTPSLKPLDGLCLRGKHWRDHRSIHQNIIPAMTGACKALGMIMPKVKDKLCGLAFRVPIVNVSVLDLTIRLKSNTSLQEIIQKVEKASNRELKNIIRISKECAVSSDFIGEAHSCILDADSSLQLKTNFFKLVCWYENEYSYACRVIDTISFSENDSRPLNIVLSSVVKQDRTQQTDCCRKEILGSTSQDTGLKYKTQQLIFKKPLSTQLSCNTQPLVSNKDSKKKSEFFKIWNYEKEPFKPGVNQKRNSFFHSCVAITSRNLEEVSAVKAQDRLEMLKKEFSKMVNVTESLLKKSHTNNFSVNSDNKSINKNSEKKIDGSLGKSYETLSDICNMTQSNRMFGDCNSDFSSLNDKSLGQESDHKKLNNISQYDVNEKVTCDVKTDNVKSKVEYIQAEKSPLPEIDNKNLNTQSTTVNKVNLFKLNSLTSKPDEINNVEEKSIKINKNEDNISKVVVKQEEIHNYTANAESSNIKSESNKETHNSVRISKDLISELNDKLRSSKTESKWQSAIKENFNKLKYPEKCAPLNQTLADINLNGFTTDGNVKIVQLDGINIELLGGENEDINRSHLNFETISTGHYSYVSDRTSLCGSPCNTSVTASNVDTYRHKDDIYDKLDSISGTDSNNSFQIHERKSQVIDLSDLTSSLEDLGRLDKICKIIEISDELSNKLFSPLNNCGMQTKKKTWSFKDLCERIKLDDFCENAFGKSSS